MRREHRSYRPNLHPLGLDLRQRFSSAERGLSYSGFGRGCHTPFRYTAVLRAQFPSGRLQPERGPHSGNGILQAPAESA